MGNGTVHTVPDKMDVLWKGLPPTLNQKGHPALPRAGQLLSAILSPQEAAQVFQSLKDVLCSYLVIKPPVSGCPFLLYTNVSSKMGLGAMLVQNISDEKCPVFYLSHKLRWRVSMLPSKGKRWQSRGWWRTSDIASLAKSSQ